MAAHAPSGAGNFIWTLGALDVGPLAVIVRDVLAGLGGRLIMAARGLGRCGEDYRKNRCSDNDDCSVHCRDLVARGAISGIMVAGTQA